MSLNQHVSVGGTSKKCKKSESHPETSDFIRCNESTGSPAGGIRSALTKNHPFVRCYQDGCYLDVGYPKTYHEKRELLEKFWGRMLEKKMALTRLVAPQRVGKGIVLVLIRFLLNETKD